MKKKMEGLNRRMKMTGKRVGALEETSVEIMHSEKIEI